MSPIKRFHQAVQVSVCAIAALFALASLLPQSALAAKNVILMIADGAGYNSWRAQCMYQGKLGQQIYDQPGWLTFSCTTYPLKFSAIATQNTAQDPSVVYSPVKAWDTTPKSDKPGGFAGYLYLTSACTDSAASATALATGQKTYLGAINWTNENQPMRGRTIAEIAKANGKSAGVVTTVQWSDATPSALGGAHSVSRKHHAQIANEMLTASWLDVIMGGGNPDYDSDGKPLAANARRDCGWVGGSETWNKLKSGQGPRKLIQTKAEFEALVDGPTPTRIVGTPQVAKTLQQSRSSRPATASNEAAEPFATPLLDSVPSLATMARGAINCLDDNPKGFYLMIEGGAVDWANHANQPDRLIEEQTSFVKTVETVVEWIESHGGWNDTLLILTADHETGLLWGPDSPRKPFEPLENRGAGKLPGMKYNAHGHSNSLVPLYARGPDSQRFTPLATGEDPTAAKQWGCSGRYIDNTDVFRVMRAAIAGD